MNDRETARYDMFGRVTTFGTDNSADFAPGSNALGHFANLTRIIAELDLAKAGQLGGGVTAKSVLIDALRLDVQNIRRTAVAMDQDAPGLADQFPAVASPSQADLITTADAYLALLAPAPNDTPAQLAAKTALAARFIANELPADFVQDLVDDRKAIDGAKDDVESVDNDGVENTSAVGRLIKAGMKEVNYLDAIMHNKYSRNADKLRAWLSASHIERTARKKKEDIGNPTGGTGTPNS
ncbi:MAG: hypothetical protein ABIT76_08870 [Chthoniobacterales bacterium]